MTLGSLVLGQSVTSPAACNNDWETVTNDRFLDSASRDFDLVVQGWSPIICIFDKIPQMLYQVWDVLVLEYSLVT